MVFARRRRRSSEKGFRPDRRGTGSYLPSTPLDGGVLSCQVYDEYGRLLPEATVTVVNQRNQCVGQGKTDSYGFFLVTVQPGAHRVSVTSGGYRRATRTAEVQTNRHTSMGSLVLQPDASMTLPQPGIWIFDPDHTEIRFIARHIGMSKITGHFTRFHGHIRVSPRFEQSRVEVSIDAASIDTGVRTRDEHLRSPDFLDVANYPQLYFDAQSMVPLRGDRWLARGTLTLRGTASPVELDTTYLGTRSWNGLRAACLCTTELRREDYSVNWQQTLGKGIAVVGSTVQIELGVQAVLQE
jgi:polyisoprenoid-binding protein YceI